MKGAVGLCPQPNNNTQLAQPLKSECKSFSALAAFRLTSLSTLSPSVVFYLWFSFCCCL